jgi:hypothetical protein
MHLAPTWRIGRAGNETLAGGRRPLASPFGSRRRHIIASGLPLRVPPPPRLPPFRTGSTPRIASPSSSLSKPHSYRRPASGSPLSRRIARHPATSTPPPRVPRIASEWPIGDWFFFLFNATRGVVASARLCRRRRPSDGKLVEIKGGLAIRQSGDPSQGRICVLKNFQ